MSYRNYNYNYNYMTIRGTAPRDLTRHLSVAKHIGLVPPFQETDVDQYFLHFENIANNLKWPKEYWTTLLQNVSIGKARSV